MRRRRDGGGRVGRRAPQAVQRASVVVLGPCGAQLVLDLRAVALGQVVEDVSLFVAHTTVDGHRAEHLVDGGPERLAAIEDDEHALLDVQAAVDEVCEQCDGDRLVLRRAVPQPERHLDAVGADAERDNATEALEVDPVEHQRRQPDVLQGA
jgi:hypothetical protein